MFAHGREHFTRHPAAEPNGLGLAALENQRVQAGFGDAKHTLGTAASLHFGNGDFIAFKGSEIVRPLVADESDAIADIRGDEERVFGGAHDAHGVALEEEQFAQERSCVDGGGGLCVYLHSTSFFVWPSGYRRRALLWVGEGKSGSLTGLERFVAGPQRMEAFEAGVAGQHLVERGSVDLEGAGIGGDTGEASAR